MTPKNAARIWADGDWIYLELPATTGDRVHVVRFPNSREGLATALTTINHRNENSMLGSKGDPTQHHVDKALADYKESMVRRFGPRIQPTAEQSIATTEILRRMGLI